MRHITSIVVCLALSAVSFGQEKSFEGITFSGAPGTVYLPVKEVGFALGLSMRSEGKKFYMEDKLVDVKMTLLDGTRLLPVRDFSAWGLSVSHDPATNEIKMVTADDREFLVTVGEKRIEISKGHQLLRAYQGTRIVAETRVSTGRKGYTTPSGRYTAGPEKSRMRYSRKYNNSPMPYSIQIIGGYFMHGYTSVPKYPASHGCIRLPMWGANPAKWLWSWTDLGTPITIDNQWTSDEGVAETTPVKDGTLKRRG